MKKYQFKAEIVDVCKEYDTITSAFGFQIVNAPGWKVLQIFFYKWDITIGFEEKPRKCRVCGCTDADCMDCIKATGHPCYWVEDDLCSRCEKK